jgi:hypothetical protein
VPIGWGDKEGVKRVFKYSDLVLATGSSVTNGSVEDILNIARNHNSTLYFYGVTIAGAARLMGLNHLCFKAT